MKYKKRMKYKIEHLKKDLIKSGFYIIKIHTVYNMCVRVWIVTGYFLFKKEALIGLLKIIGVQNNAIKTKLKVIPNSLW